MIWMRWFRDSPDVLLVTYCPTPPRTPMGMLWNNLKESADILWWSSPCGKDWTRKYFCVFWLYLMPCYRSSQSWLCMQDMKWQIELIWIAQVLPKQSCYLWERQVVPVHGSSDTFKHSLPNRARIWNSCSEAPSTVLWWPCKTWPFTWLGFQTQMQLMAGQKCYPVN